MYIPDLTKDPLDYCKIYIYNVAHAYTSRVIPFTIPLQFHLQPPAESLKTYPHVISHSVSDRRIHNYLSFLG